MLYKKNLQMEYKPVHNIRPRIPARRVFYLCGQAFLCLYLWVVADKTNWLHITVAGVASSTLLTLLIYKEISCNPDRLPPHLIYLIASLVRLGFSSLWLGAVLAFGSTELLRVGRWNVEENIIYGLFLLQFGDLLLNFGYFVFDSGNREEHSSWVCSAERISLGGCLLLYLCGWSIKLFLHFVPLGSVPAVIGYVGVALPMLAATRLLRLQDSEVSRAKFFTLSFLILMTLLDILLAFQSYMKSAVLMVLIPFVLHFLKKILADRRVGFTGKINSLLIVFLFAVFVGLVVFPFSQLRRASYNAYSKTYGASVVDCFTDSLRAAIPGTSEFQYIHRFPSSGFWGLFHRHCNTFTAAWSYTYVSSQGSTDGEFILSAFPALIPRILWPEKPPFSPSAKVSVMIGFAKTVETATTSTDAGSMSGGLYLDLGWRGLILGMFLNGAALALVTKLLSNQGSIFAGVGWMMLYSACSNHFEASLDGNVTTWGLVVVISVLPTLFVMRFQLIASSSLKGRNSF